ncbi:TetR/AcrR family transcriptional regulator [Aeromicrobium fastidiosum]|uniref:TetR/AcrR family transcriptional regulator n=1 Tax=Aeromicrobium fastidiosum TaxID=52699 RepID=A0A641APM4_9ACTN|nr:TetR/AcrR family transcriptional regulator [Aeromicrobium fastidiosum]KAA1380054.1 TetR/AcrR family transcriptional regulator [Aeromicrobium fastidiosum]MBP2389580.1 AcrR family transcriptional regulator [Aeromicrobium fastidiosum]
MSTDVDPCELARPLRADAVRNRELILCTAAQVFAEQGLEAGYDEIARRAGIGVGTVYRRFPERAGLIQALFESQIAEVIDLAEQAAERPDSWDGLVWFLERAIERQVADRGLKEVLVRSISEEEHRAMGRERFRPAIEGLVVRAQRDGTLRGDVSTTDIGINVMVISSMTTPGHPELWRRYFALFVDGLRARPDQAPLPLAAPEDDAMDALMCSLRGRD